MISVIILAIAVNGPSLLLLLTPTLPPRSIHPIHLSIRLILCPLLYYHSPFRPPPPLAVSLYSAFPWDGERSSLASMPRVDSSFCIRLSTYIGVIGSECPAYHDSWHLHYLRARAPRAFTAASLPLDLRRLDSTLPVFSADPADKKKIKLNTRAYSLPAF